MSSIFIPAWWLPVVVLAGAVGLTAFTIRQHYFSRRQYRDFNEFGMCMRCWGSLEAADDPILGLCPNCDGEGRKKS